ncbi:MAG: transposase [Trichodesmium erythraeum GBRTRLIN201]|nr:transposase [Trichodesmium erythraeum GBRTRLIN201]
MKRRLDLEEHSSCLFGLPGRQKQRFIESIFHLMGLDLPEHEIGLISLRVPEIKYSDTSYANNRRDSFDSRFYRDQNLR